MFIITFLIETPGGNFFKRITEERTTEEAARGVAFSTKRYWERRGFACYFSISQETKEYVVYDNIGNVVKTVETEKEAKTIVNENLDYTYSEVK